MPRAAPQERASARAGPWLRCRTLPALAILLVWSSGERARAAAPEVQVTPQLVEISPDCAQFGAPRCATPGHATLEITYRLGAPAMEPGGGIAVSLGDVLGGRYRRRGRFRWADLQSTRPQDSEFVTARTSRPGVAAGILIATTPDGGTEAVALVTGRLLLGDEIVVTLGNRSGGGPGMRAPGVPFRTSVLVRENLQGAGGLFRYLDEAYGLPFPAVETHGQPADNLLITLPSEARPGEAVTLTLRAVKGCEGIESSAVPVRDHVGAVRLLASDPLVQIPQAIQFTPEDRGVLRVPIVFATPGWHRVWVGRGPGSACTEDGDPAGVSNPIRVGGSPGPERTLWGLLHVHSGRSRDGAGETEEAFRSAREEGALDFLAVSDHCDSARYDFNESGRISDLFDDPGTFTTFRAFEWTDGIAGHRHVIYPDSGAGQAPCHLIETATQGLVEAPTLVDLDREAAAAGAVTILHHTLWSRFVEAFSFGDPLAPPVTQKLLEVHSAHGRSEFFNNEPYLIHGDPDSQQPPSTPSSFQDALRLGFRLGVTAGSDNHLSQADSYVALNPGTRNVRFARQGLTAILSGSISRPALFEALRQRRSYGTTGARIWMRFEANGRPMGSVIRGAGSLILRVEVQGTSAIKRIVLVRDGVEESALWTPVPDSLGACVLFHVERSSGRDTQEHSYYVRVEQVDDHMAWSSPIWHAPRTATGPGRRILAPRDGRRASAFHRPEIVSAECPAAP